MDYAKDVFSALSEFYYARTKKLISATDPKERVFHLLFIYLFIYLFMYLCIYLFVYLFIHSFIYLFIYFVFFSHINLQMKISKYID